MEVVVHTPVFKYNHNGRTVPSNRNVALVCGYIDSTFTKMGVDTVQYIMDRRAGIYASFDRFSAFKTHLSHFNKQTIEVDEAEIPGMPIVGIYVEKEGDCIQYDESYMIWGFTTPLNHVSRKMAIHFYNKKDSRDAQVVRAGWNHYWMLGDWVDAMDMLEYGVKRPYFRPYQTEEWARKTVSFFDILYRGYPPVNYKEYEIVDLDTRKKRGANHYVYTLSYDGVVIYVGYTMFPKERLAQHVYYQTNEYLKHAIDRYGKPEMRVVRKFKNADDALCFETELIREYAEKTTLANIAKNPYGPGYI